MEIKKDVTPGYFDVFHYTTMIPNCMKKVDDQSKNVARTTHY